MLTKQPSELLFVLLNDWPHSKGMPGWRKAPDLKICSISHGKMVLWFINHSLLYFVREILSFKACLPWQNNKSEMVKGKSWGLDRTITSPSRYTPHGAVPDLPADFPSMERWCRSSLMQNLSQSLFFHLKKGPWKRPWCMENISQNFRIKEIQNKSWLPYHLCDPRWVLWPPALSIPSTECWMAQNVCIITKWDKFTKCLARDYWLGAGESSLHFCIWLKGIW